MMGVDEATSGDHRPGRLRYRRVAIDLPLQREPAPTYVTSDNRTGPPAPSAICTPWATAAIATITGPLDPDAGCRTPAGDRYQLARLALDLAARPLRRARRFLPVQRLRLRAPAALKLPEPRRPRPSSRPATRWPSAPCTPSPTQVRARRRPWRSSASTTSRPPVAARPALTTVAQDTLSLGAAAIDTLLALVKTKDTADAAPPSMPVLTPTRLVVRQSCGAGR